ncbi:hypothetical protein [Peribacillus frigoritolerans]|uniref:hypothetical protein n=1 Tax=Peribacillus frigoritolerans TaxID=450367 RepID=UPI00362A43A6
MKTQEKVMITEDDFSIGDLISVARHHAPLELSMSVKKRISQGRDIVERLSRKSESYTELRPE